MARSREKAMGRRSGKPFLRLPKEILNSDKYASLSPKAVKLLLDLGSQYNGHNNGDLCASFSIMQARGWRSKNTLYSAIHELEKTGFIVRTKQGGMNYGPNLFALSWEPIHECKGKLDIEPTTVPPNTWKKTQVQD